MSGQGKTQTATQRSLWEVLSARADETPDAPLLAVGNDLWSYQRFAEEAERVARAMAAHGVHAGDRVALHMQNIAKAALVYLASARLGATLVPVNTRFKSEEVRSLLSRVQPVLYLGQDELYRAVAPLGEVVPKRGRFVIGLDRDHDEARPWERLFDDPVPDHLPARGDAVAGEAPVVLLGTSGTTGQSKLVAYTNATLAGIMEMAGSRNLHAGSVMLPLFPLMHAGGCCALAFIVAVGGCLVLLPTYEADAALDLIERWRCTCLVAAPYALPAVAAAQRGRPRDVDSLVDCHTGGDITTPDVERGFTDAIGRPLFSIWSATEDVSCMVPVPASEKLIRPGTGTETRLVGMDGRDVVDPETVGELLVRSPSLAAGYWQGPGQVEPFPDGWFASGDLMRREADGALRMVGRKKDLIIRGTSNISPVEVEMVLREHESVAEVAVAGLPDPVLGQRVVGAVILAPGQDASALDAVLAAARTRLADYKVPERLVAVDAIPRNALGKVNRDDVTTLVRRALG